MNPPPSGLRSRFMAWCLRHGSSETTAWELWVRLSSSYGEIGRHYHHLGHIASSLEEFDATGSDHSLLEGAIWFHDVIYDPRRGDNEAASITWFFDATAAWLDTSAAAAIARLIEVTDFRRPPCDDLHSWLMVDIDLAILSAAPEAYTAYARSIRREYAHVGDRAFREGRTRVIEGFLDRPIYRSSGFIGREERARENMRRELACLRSGGML